MASRIVCEHRSGLHRPSAGRLSGRRTKPTGGRFLVGEHPSSHPSANVGYEIGKMPRSRPRLGAPGSGGE